MFKSFYILSSNSHNTTQIKTFKVAAKLEETLNTRGFLSESLNSISVLVGELKEQYLDNILQFSPNEFMTLYTKKMNEQGIYFRSQLSYIKLENDNDNENENDENELLSNTKFFFTKECKLLDDTNKIQFLLEPEYFVMKLETAISEAIRINKDIAERHNDLMLKDKELLDEKNQLLNSMNVFKFSNIFTIVKKREKINYILIDIDTEISNILIELNYLKYSKIKKEDPIDVLESYNKWQNNLNRLITEYDLLIL